VSTNKHHLLRQRGVTSRDCNPSSCYFFLSNVPMRRIFIVIGIMILIASKSFSLTMRNMNNNNRLNFFRLNVASLSSDSSKSARESDLNRALEFARLMDKQHGLCTEPSRKAWCIVDAIYENMQAFRAEEVQLSTRSNEQPSRKKSTEVQLNNESIIQTQAMYFF